MYWSAYGSGYVPLIISDLQCTGVEESILNCDRDLQSITQCSYSTIAGVKCEGTNIFRIIQSRANTEYIFSVI